MVSPRPEVLGSRRKCRCRSWCGRETPCCRRAKNLGHTSPAVDQRGFYRDIAVFAFPSLVGSNVKGSAQCHDEPGRLRRPISCHAGQRPTDSFRRTRMDSIRIRQAIHLPDNDYFIPMAIVFRPTDLKVSVSDDGENFREVVRLEPPRHGWQNGSGDVSHSIEPTTARYFRFTYDTRAPNQVPRISIRPSGSRR